MIDVLICPTCKGYDLSSANKKIICINCNNEYLFDDENNQVIFDEVYKTKNIDEEIFSVKKNKLKYFTWRELNYLKINEYINKIPKNILCADVGSGPMTNKNLLSKFQNTIYIDGAKFKSVNIVCDFEKLIPLKDNSVDFILLSNVLEHMFYPEILLNEIYRVLKTNGKCLILVPYSIKLHQERNDYFRYTKQALKRLLENSNFFDHKIKEIGSVSNVLGSILKHDMNTIRKKSSFVKIVIFILQRLIHKLFLIQRSFDSTTINNQIPQGYSIEIKK